jgi:hypothetical protein
VLSATGVTGWSVIREWVPVRVGFCAGVFAERPVPVVERVLSELSPVLIKILELLGIRHCHVRARRPEAGFDVMLSSISVLKFKMPCHDLID